MRSKEELAYLLKTRQLNPDDLTPEEKEIVKGMLGGNILGLLLKIAVGLIILYALVRVYIF